LVGIACLICQCYANEDSTSSSESWNLINNNEPQVQNVDNELGKRIIEFKKDLEQEIAYLSRYERELTELNRMIHVLPVLSQRVRGKRPSIYPSRNKPLANNN
jgi:hypothetical protein